MQRAIRARALRWGRASASVVLTPRYGGLEVVEMRNENPDGNSINIRCAIRGLPEPADPTRFTSVKGSVPSSTSEFSFETWKANRFEDGRALRGQGGDRSTSAATGARHCHDGRRLRNCQLYRRYRSQGLEIVLLVVF